MSINLRPSKTVTCLILVLGKTTKFVLPDIGTFRVDNNTFNNHTEKLAKIEVQYFHGKTLQDNAYKIKIQLNAFGR